jgi:hypothetical protein
MLIQKGGISREIEEKRLQEYKEKGYAAVENTTANAVKTKPLEKMTVEELKAYAEQNTIDIAAAKNKVEMLALISATKPPE